AAGTLVAAAAAPGATGGSYAATPLSPSATWQAGSGTGEFSWSYPLRTPPSLGGPAPSVTLGYSSGSVDGRVSSANAQPSWIGEGFDFWPGYVERKYRGCAEDGALPTGDQCWYSDNATISLNGRASELVRDDASGRWRLKDDDGSRVERLTGAVNGDSGEAGVDGIGEYWKVTTTDGTQYFFGRHRLPGWSAGRPETNSTWTLPVVGNNPADPCHGTVHADSWCQQAWRWNLDHVVDAHGNALTYFYDKEENRYDFGLGNQTLPYTRGGTLDRIEYGLRAGQEFSTPAPMRVLFTTASRCVPGTPCNVADWPDTPWDRDCLTTSCTGKVTPTFWSTRRLAKVTTQVRAGTAYDDVDSWALTHEYANSGDSTTSPVLWLDKLVHTGHSGPTDASMPAIDFNGLAMDNKINTSAATSVRKVRMTSILNESGGSVAITYKAPECTPANLPANAETNTKRCLPVRWAPQGQPERQDWFHKHVVEKVDAVDGTGVADGTTTAYEYVGPAAWHYDDDDGLVPAERKTWAQWRGYEVVRTRVGNTQDGGRTLSEVRYYRGMDGDRAAPAGGHKTARVTDSRGGTVPDHERLQGMVRETATYLGDGGPVVSRAINDGWVSPPTATDVRPWGSIQARFTDVSVTRTDGPITDGIRETRVEKTFDNAYGQPLTVNDLGDVAKTGDEECTRLTYVRNTAAWLVAAVGRAERYALPCAAAPAGEADVISDTRTSFDDAPNWQTPPTRGDVTKVEDLATWSAAGSTYDVTSRAAYDAYGRSTATWDSAEQRSTTTYEPPTGGPVVSFTSKNPLGHASYTKVDPGHGGPVLTVDPNDRRTELAYDGLGRLRKTWLPGHPRATNPDLPSSEFQYLIRQTGGVSSVTTRSLRNDGGYNISVELYDGLLRHRQSQIASPAGGSTLADTFYDSRGLVVKQHGAYRATSSPSTTLVPVPTETVPGWVRTVYDAAGRRTAEIFGEGQVEKWRTTAVHGGDRIGIIPPAGEAPTQVLLDARGRATELREFTGATLASPYDATTYQFNRKGEQVGVTDSAGNTWTYAYDVRGRKTVSTDPDRGPTTTTYDDAGRVRSTKDSRGNELFTEYDALSRPTKMRNGAPDGPVRVEWAYDTLAVGSLTSATRHTAGGAFTTAVTGYDIGYRPTGTTVTLPASTGALAGTYAFTASYLRDGSVDTATSPAKGGLPAETFTTGYSGYGLPTSLSSELGSYATGTTYSPYGEFTGATLGAAPNRVKIIQEYLEGSRRLDRVKVTREGSADTVAEAAYTFDPAGNLTKLTETATGQLTDTQCFTYDYLRRLDRAWTPTTGDCAAAPTVAGLGGPAKYWTDWQHDKVGNRTKQTRYGTAAGTETTTYEYPAAGQPQPHSLLKATVVSNTGTRILQWGYDKAGNTENRPAAGGGNQTLTWDVEGRLEKLVENGNTTSFTYDANGGRLLRTDATGTTAYIGDLELHAPANGGAVTGTRYYSHAGMTIATRTAAGVTWLVGNNQGTATLAINSADTSQVTRRRFTPYGEPRGGEPAWPGERGFVGGTKDKTGLTHLGAREYDPGTGRFISVDPVLDPGQPQQLHGYSYANNNPTTWSDPSGLLANAEVGGGGGSPAPDTSGPGGSTGKGGSGGGSAPYVEPPLPPDLAAMEAEANSLLSKNWFDIVLEVGGDLLREFLHVDDLNGCFGRGDIGACISLAVDIIPWSKVFELPKLISAIRRAWSAVNAFWERQKWAVQILTQVEQFRTTARAAARAAAEAAAQAEAIAQQARATAARAAAAAKAAASRAAAQVKPVSKKAPSKKPEVAEAKGCNSFVPGTRVLMADGTTKPIEELQPGDEVVATDPETGETSTRSVSTRITGSGGKTLVDVTVDTDGTAGDDTETLTGTDGHPYWVADQARWLKAIDLKPGDELLSPDGSRVRVVAVSVYGALAAVHNLTVADVHTYYVMAADTPVLVHNCGDGLLHPGQNGADDSPQDWIPMNSWTRNGANLTEGNYHFVVMPDKSVRTFHESIWETAPEAGHTSLSRGRGVLAAGTFDVGSGGAITRFDNFSGHYRPSAATQGVIRDSLGRSGFNLGGAHWDPFEFS
ncbi:MAG TPA: polymorphic toxin-type HINT domain-containing protein, partial [Pilimelia sp.]|nr:polymorphic toxin-type HINT domain-containing protein [Pilimelia sp.]